ncbi:MAG TPA: alginate lyase family protein, partial [Vicinamibacterales bacterium]
MNWSTFVTRGKKAMRMPPRVLLARLQDEVRQQTKRPWATAYPRLLSDRTVLGASSDVSQWWDSKLLSGPFFLRPSDRTRWSQAYQQRYPGRHAAIVAAADTVLRHEFDLLGSGPVHLGATLPWHSDFKTGREWPVQFCKDIEYLELERPSDVKVPWELSRAQHLPLLGQAYWFTGDERYAREFVAEVEDWIARNPLAYGVNWACAMDVALRATNWMWGFYFMGAAQASAGDAFRKKFIRSLYIHGEFVSRNLETSDINGNHYLSDAVGLVFMGVMFGDTADGARWLETGERILTREIEAQIYSDGVDHEASTPYHRLVLELFLTGFLLLEKAGRKVPVSAWQRLERMLDFVAAYTKPNGLVPLVGDADDGRVQKLGTQDLNDHRYLLSTCAARFGRGDHKRDAGGFADESFWLLGPEGSAAFDALPAATESPRSTAFREGGFFVLRSPSSHVFIDCGDVGMRGRGGHGHNDILSFELFMNGANIVTDCGAFVYTASREWRNRFRSTAFHNTIQVDGEEVNRFVEPNALWQLVDDAKPAEVRWSVGPSGDFWQGSHTGYQRLPQPCTPTRAVWIDRLSPVVAIRDAVTGVGRRRISVR